MREYRLLTLSTMVGALAAGDPRPWADGELGTVARAAKMFSGIEGIDGTTRVPNTAAANPAGVSEGL